jgi:hypothetical protein
MVINDEKSFITSGAGQSAANSACPSPIPSTEVSLRTGMLQQVASKNWFKEGESAARDQCYKNTMINYRGNFKPTFSRVKMTLKNDLGLKNIIAILG